MDEIYSRTIFVDTCKLAEVWIESIPSIFLEMDVASNSAQINIETQCS